MSARRCAGLAVLASLALTSPASAAWEFVHEWDVGNGAPSGVAVGQGNLIYHSAFKEAAATNYVEVTAGMEHPEETPGTLIDTIGGPGDKNADGNFHKPMDVETDTDGTVYVLDWGSDFAEVGPRVQAFEPDGDLKWSLGTFGTEQGGHFRYPSGIEVSSNGLYVLDQGNDRVQQFDKSTRNFIRMWGMNVGGDGTDGVHVCTEAAECHQGDASSGDGFFWQPSGIAIDPGGNVWVGDFVLGTVQKFTSTGSYLTKLTGFTTVHDIAFHPDGRLFVIGGRSGSTNWVWEYGSDLQLDSSFAPAGTGDGQLDRPVGLDFDSNGYLYVTDQDTGLISVFSEDGPPDTGGGGTGGGDDTGGGGDTGGGDTTQPPVDTTVPPIVSPPLNPTPPSIPPPNPPRVQRPTRTTRTVDSLREAVETGMVLICSTPPGTVCVSTTGVAYRCTPNCARIARTVKIGASRFTTQPGASTKVRFKLNARGRKLLKKRKRMKIAVTLKTTRAGMAPVTTKQSLTLKLKRR